MGISSEHVHVCRFLAGDMAWLVTDGKKITLWASHQSMYTHAGFWLGTWHENGHISRASVQQLTLKRPSGWGSLIQSSHTFTCIMCTGPPAYAICVPGLESKTHTLDGRRKLSCLVDMSQLSAVLPQHVFLLLSKSSQGLLRCLTDTSQLPAVLPCCSGTRVRPRKSAGKGTTRCSAAPW